MKIIALENNTCGINCVYEKENTVIKDSLYNGTLLIPLGEALFSVLEGIDILNQIALKDEKDLPQNLNRYFAERNIKINFLQKYDIDITEVKRLTRIIDFLNLCSDNATYCCIESLESLALGILKSSSEILSLFSPVGYLKVRKYHSPIKLPFTDSTKNLIAEMKDNYSEFAFSTETNFSNFSELCIISLFEIFSLGLQIKRCNMCNHFYVGNSYDKYCNRDLLQNDFKGCKNYKISLTNICYSDDKLIKEYKKIYARLHSRAKGNSIISMRIYEDFKNEWAKINKELKGKPNRRVTLETFLSSERWK